MVDDFNGDGEDEENPFITPGKAVGGGVDNQSGASARQPTLFGDEPIFTTRDRFDYLRWDFRRTPTFEPTLLVMALRRRPNLDNVTWRGWRELEIDEEVFMKLPEGFKYISILIKPEEKRDTGSILEQDIDPPLTTKHPVYVQDKEGKMVLTLKDCPVTYPEPPLGYIRVLRPVRFYTPDGVETRRGSRHHTGFGLIPKDEVEAVFRKLLKTDKLDRYFNQPLSAIPPDDLWRIRQLYTEARLEVFLGPREDPADPYSPRRWREGYINFAKIRSRFRDYVRRKRTLGWSNSKIYTSENIFAEFLQLVFSEWRAFWDLMNQLAQQADPEQDLQDPWQSAQALEDLADLFSVRPPVSVSKIYSEDGEKEDGKKLVSIRVNREESPSDTSTRYDAESIRKFIEGNNFGLGLWQNADEGRVPPGAAVIGRDGWFGGPSDRQLMCLLVLAGIPLDIRAYLGPKIAWEMVGDVSPSVYLGPDNPLVLGSQSILPPFTQIWSDHVDRFAGIYGKSKGIVQDRAQNLGNGGGLALPDIAAKYGDDLVNWQDQMVWVFVDTKTWRWCGSPGPGREVLMAFHQDDKACWLDLISTTGGDSYAHPQQWRYRVQEEVTRAGIPDDLFAVDNENAFNHPLIMLALWLYQSADSLRRRLEHIQDEARINRELNYLKEVKRETAGLPTAQHGRLDMEEVVWDFRFDTFEWYLRRFAEYYFFNFAHLTDVPALFAEGFPWRTGDDDDSWDFWGKVGVRPWKGKVFTTFIGRGEVLDVYGSEGFSEREFLTSHLQSRTASIWMYSRINPPEDGITIHARRCDIADWLVTFSGFTEPTNDEWTSHDEVKGLTMQVAERIRLGGKKNPWDGPGGIKEQLEGLRLGFHEVQRAYYCYAPVHGKRLD